VEQPKHEICSFERSREEKRALSFNASLSALFYLRADITGIHGANAHQTVMNVVSLFLSSKLLAFILLSISVFQNVFLSHTIVKIILLD
jgi:hypothetical protein